MGAGSHKSKKIENYVQMTAGGNIAINVKV